MLFLLTNIQLTHAKFTNIYFKFVFDTKVKTFFYGDFLVVYKQSGVSNTRKQFPQSWASAIVCNIINDNNGHLVVKGYSSQIGN